MEKVLLSVDLKADVNIPKEENVVFAVNPATLDADVEVLDAVVADADVVETDVQVDQDVDDK